MTDPLVGRATDPSTSTTGIRKKVPTLQHHVLNAALMLGQFTDSELTAQVELITGKAQQRGVIARTRLTLERAGHITRDAELRHNQITFHVESTAAAAA
jgi:hypothetical protein